MLSERMGQNDNEMSHVVVFWPACIMFGLADTGPVRIT